MGVDGARAVAANITSLSNLENLNLLSTFLIFNH